MELGFLFWLFLGEKSVNPLGFTDGGLRTEVAGKIHCCAAHQHFCFEGVS